MCGRYAMRSSLKEIAEALEAVSEKINEDKARYNIAPTQAVVAARESADDVRELVKLKWGLVPAWAKDPGIGSRLINARSETVAEKPAFKGALRLRRCLIPADGFYEWARTETGNKQPFYFRMKDERPFAFAGLWERWGDGRETIESCTILTTEANEVLSPMHDRMPVIVAPGDYGLWLDQKVTKADQLTPLLRPYPAADMTSHPVSTSVNNPRYDGEDLLAPLINSQ